MKWGAAINATSAGRQNRALILETVQRTGAISRSRLARSTGMTPATITNAVRDLIDLGLLMPTGDLAPRQRATPGAPSFLLGLDRRHHRVLSIHQGVSRVRLGLHDIGGAVLASSDLATGVGEPALRTVERTVQAVRRLLRAHKVTRDRVRGVGLGAVGLIDPESGFVRSAPNLGWVDVPLGALLQKALGWPVIARNNVYGMAAGELRFGGVPEANAVYVYVGTGIGAGIIADNHVLDGEHGAAGEIGHLVVPGGGPCSCGKSGCLETVAAELSIVRRAWSVPEVRAAAKAGHKPAVARLVDRAKAGDDRAREILTQVAENLAFALAQVTEIIDPGAIIVSGIVVDAGPLFLEPLATTLRRSTFAARGRNVSVRPAHFGDEAGMVGAAALALEAFVYNPRAELLAERTSRVAR
ncbi:MAG: ROK family transcriptional regulator [Candidatus Dormibacteraceae bacterium]